MWRCSQVTDAVRGEPASLPFSCAAPSPSKTFTPSHLNPPTTQAFANLGLLENLDMDSCYSEAITDAAFAHLHSLKTLRMNECKQPTITDAAFRFFGKLETLYMQGCTQASITAAAFKHLPAACNLILDETRRDQVEAAPHLLKAYFCPPYD